MIPKVYYYYVENNDVECKIATSLNDLESIILKDENWPAFLHIAFDGPLSSSVRDDLLNSPKALFCSNGLSYSGLPSSWAFNLNKIMHISDFISYPCEIAFGQDLAVLTDDLSSLNNQIKNIKPGTKVFHDYALIQWEWSVRTQNVLKENNILLLSQLVTYSDRILLLLPNFGRKSLREITSKLEELGLSLSMDLSEYEITNAFDDNSKLKLYSPNSFEDTDNIIVVDTHKEKHKFIYHFLNSIEKCDDERWINILKKRAGFVPEGCQTLEQISKGYSVTRERIRQIEAKALKKMRNYNIGWNQDFFWDNKINLILDSRIYPLSIDDFKKVNEFSDIDGIKIDTLKYIFSNLNTPIYILNELDNVFITRLHQNEFDKIMIDIKNFLSSSNNKTLNSIYDEGKKFFPNKAKELVNKTLDFCLQNSSISTNENNEEYLVEFSFRMSAYAAAVEIFEKSERLLETVELAKIVEEQYPYFNIRNVQNRLQEVKGLYPFKHRSWGMIKHLNLDNKELAIIKDEIGYYLDNLNKDQFHGREILEVINQKKLIKNVTCDEYIVSAVVREFFDIPYLGRQMFANPKSEIGKRQEIYDVIMQVLIKNGKPMHNKNILLEANKVRSIKGQIHEKPPIILLGEGYYALDYWDDDTKKLR